MTSIALRLKDLACERGGRPLFSGLNAELRAGQLLRVQGANGAGKTSLLRMVCGLLGPSQGQVLWQGEPVATACQALGHHRVYIGHAAGLKDDFSPLENLRLACALAAAPVDEVAARRALQLAGLRGHEHTHVRRLSQGQRRRSVLARLALQPAPALWVLDEPFNALDVGAVEWLCGLLREHLHQGGLAVLTSHQDIEIDAASQQVLSL